jgi:hypothetical protein
MKPNLEQRIKANLAHSAEHIDTQTLQRLQEIRRVALTPKIKKKTFSFYRWAPATGLIFCSFIAAILLVSSPKNQELSNSSEQTAMLELIENPDEMDSLSDPGFYLWLNEISADTQESMGQHAV